MRFAGALKGSLRVVWSFAQGVLKGSYQSRSSRFSITTTHLTSTLQMSNAILRALKKHQRSPSTLTKAAGFLRSFAEFLSFARVEILSDSIIHPGKKMSSARVAGRGSWHETSIPKAVVATHVHLTGSVLMLPISPD